MSDRPEQMCDGSDRYLLGHIRPASPERGRPAEVP